MAKIFELLANLGETSNTTRELYAKRTRDAENLEVWRDSVSGVIYIDDHYCGDEHYSGGSYDQQNIRSNFDRNIDLQRRLKAYECDYVGKNICDFGCGKGDFILTVAERAKACAGVELQTVCRDRICDSGGLCYETISDITFSIDSCFLFHTLEHFPDPLSVLLDIREHLKKGASLIVEVPHANDVLLSCLQCEAFKQFTLWSPHLILHTRSSLHKLLARAGFHVDLIEGVQRYPLSNHLAWLSEGKPGGHKSALNALDTEQIRFAYEAALQKIDATDTLVARARCL